ncbi:MAG TPA: hypothetical protein VMT03_09545, partial [Polyangia bacterium]|nr:hypothetical protein [Polyangia bacterium]
MITKPPFELAASGGSDHDVEDMSDQIVVDSSQDVTVEASEESTLEIEDAPAGTETPPPTPAPLMASSMVTPPPMTSTAEVAHRGAPTLLGMPLPSLPLPGATSPSSLSLTPGPSSKDEDATLKVAEDDDDEEVTVMARPSVTDDEEEATKVEPAETAIRAASIKDEDDELTAALSTQATLERERALRKSLPPSLDVPLSAHSYGSSSDDFEDPDDDEVLATSTPGIVSVEDDLESATGNYSRGTDPDADQEEPSSELEAVLAPRRPTPGISGSPLSGSLGGSPFAGSP